MLDKSSFHASVAGLLLLAASPAGATVQVGTLRCENLANPLGLDAPQPALTWQLAADGRAERQTAYQVLVASAPAELDRGRGDLWDSGKIFSDETAHIAYSGKALASRQACFWKVRVWDQTDRPSAWSTAASWEMGLLQPGDWQAAWIARTADTNVTAAPLLRRGFTLDGKIKQARAYFCGLGYGELYLNGQRVGDHFLDPGYTRYDRRVLYVTHDVTRLLKRGDNAVGVILGNGWYNVQNRAAWDFDLAPWRAAPKLRLQIEVEFTDGRRVTVSSDPSWKSAASPILANTIYSGENYDARLEQPGWAKPGFDDSRWASVLLVDPPRGILAAQAMPPIRVDRVLSAARITEPQPGVFVFDFGQNLAGYSQLAVRGPAGTVVTLKYGERLETNGLVDQAAIAQHLHRFDASQSFQTDTYTLKGHGRETWHSRFAYYGFQYVEVRGFPGKPGPDSLRAAFCHSAVPEAGEFECSNPLLNRIWRATRCAYLSNLQGIPTDCPHREKNGWTGDAHLAAEQAMFNYFPAALNSKWLNDLGDEQQPDGMLPGIVPTAGWGYKWGNGPAWDSAFLLLPYYQYLYYGDTGDFRRHYAGMKRYVDYLTGKARNGIVSLGLNDWAPYKTKTEAPITSTAYYYVDAKIVALAARVLGKEEDARHYAELAESIKTAFNRKFFQPATGVYDNGSQTALSCALYQGLVEPADQARVLDQLVEAVHRADWHIDTGILGAKYLLNTLTDNGRTDVAYRIVAQKDLPSWGWWLEQGATTLWEEWNGSSSRNHIMYGDVSAWFYKALAGINPDPAAPGFKHFILKPNPVGDLTAARAEYPSIRGLIVSDWTLRGGQFRWRVVVPPNTTATIWFPIADPQKLKAGRQALAQTKGLSPARVEAGRTVCEAQSGEYHFECPASK